jgi:dipeptidyl aminopeptidase/acylaminoacyl peptidase
MLVGDSGGATVASVILGRYPGLANAAVLVRSPCDLMAYQAAHHRVAAFRSDSPDRYIDRIPLDTQVAVIVGAADTNTFPFPSERYVAALKARGVSATLTEIPGGGGSRPRVRFPGGLRDGGRGGEIDRAGSVEAVAEERQCLILIYI